MLKRKAKSKVGTRGYLDLTIVEEVLESLLTCLAGLCIYYTVPAAYRRVSETHFNLIQRTMSRLFTVVHTEDGKTLPAIELSHHCNATASIYSCYSRTIR